MGQVINNNNYSNNSSNSCSNVSMKSNSMVIGKRQQYILNTLVFVSSFCFCSYCIYRTLSPLVIPNNNNNNINNYNDRRVLVEDVACAANHISAGAAVGLAAGAAVVAGSLLLVGLSPVGPIAGGYFASSMGAGVASGSMMASLQSIAMTGATYATGAGVGAVAGAGVGASVGC